MAIGHQVTTPINQDYYLSIGTLFTTPLPLISYLQASPNNYQIAHLNTPIAGAIPAINIKYNNIGIKKYNPAVALDVWGSINMSGALVLTSDSTLKTNIQTFTINATNKLKQFRPVTYEWIHKSDTGMYGTRYGFTAQQIQTVMPDLVKTGVDGIKTLNYTFSLYKLV